MLRNSGRSNLIDIDATLVRETQEGNPDAGAFLLDTGKAEKTWIPKSVCQRNDDGTFSMPESIALEKGLI